jgi:hypothetical protein
MQKKQQNPRPTKGINQAFQAILLKQPVETKKTPGADRPLLTK